MIPQLIFELLLPYLMNPMILAIVVTLVFLFYNNFIVPGPTLYRFLPFLEKPEENKEACPTPAPVETSQTVAKPLDLSTMEPSDALKEILKPAGERELTSQELQVAAMQAVPTADLEAASLGLGVTEDAPVVTPMPMMEAQADLPMPPDGITGDEETFAPANPTNKKPKKTRLSKKAF